MLQDGVVRILKQQEREDEWLEEKAIMLNVEALLPRSEPPIDTWMSDKKAQRTCPNQ